MGRVVRCCLLRSPLTDLEFEMIKGHAAVGTTIIGTVDFPRPIREIVGQHHERINGSGYPNGLEGTEISPEALIVALAEITENRGTLYDSDPVDACLLLFAKDRFEFDAEQALSPIDAATRDDR